MIFPSLTWPLSLSLSLVRGRVELESADLYLPPALPTCLCLCTVTPLPYNALEVSTTLHNSATYYANIQHNFLVSRRFVRKTNCQDDISSGWPDDLGRFVRTMPDDLGRFVRTDSCQTFCQEDILSVVGMASLGRFVRTPSVLQHIVATFGNFWQIVATFGTFWQLLAIFAIF